MNFINTIKCDLARIAEPSFINFLKWYFFPKETTFKYIFWFRATQYCKKYTHLKYTIGVLCYFMYRHYSVLYGIHINTNISVGEGLYIVHSNGIYVNVKSIGNNFTIYQNVTLGSKKLNDDIIPTVEDNVTIYTGSVVVGDICLHSGCIIAANSFVNSDIGSSRVVGGIPAKELKGKIDE